MAAQPAVISTAPGAASTATPTHSATRAARGSTASSSTANDKDAAADSSAADLPVRDRAWFKKAQLERLILRDDADAARLLDQQNRAKAKAQETHARIAEYQRVRWGDWKPFFPPSKLYGEGYRGYGNGFTDLGPQGGSRIVYPSQKPRPGKRTTPPFRWKRKDMLKQAEQHEELVPIRLDVDWDKIKLRDTLTWNLHERLLTVDLFAAQLVEDMGIKGPALQPVYEQVVNQINEQLADFYPFAYSEEDALDPELPYSAYKNDEMRILVKLNITIGAATLVDQFEWEINNPMNSPEEFAACMATDLSLSGEFTTAIAHCIREQVQLFTRSLYSVGHPFDGRPIEDADLVSAFLPTPIPAVFRPQQQAKEYAPYLYELNEADLERNEMIFSREQRRQKRSVNRRGGPQLPDLKERARTIRTLIVSSVLPGAATDIEDSRLYKKVIGAPTRKRPGARDGDISDSEESEDSAPDSPAAQALVAAGTARTRGMRGAASAAQQRMANLGRSETPEASIVHHHETRISARRFGRDAREETEEPAHLIVTLKVNREKLRKLLREAKAAKAAAPSGPHTPAPSHTAAQLLPQPTPTTSAPAVPLTPGIMAPPPTTPSAANKALQPKAAASGHAAAAAAGKSAPAVQLGRLPAPAPVNGVPPPTPPPPDWLIQALEKLNEQYPGDSFEGTMKYSPVSKTTDLPVLIPAGQAASDDIKYMHLPRVRCLDCPGKLYTPGPEMTAGNFEVHLKNRQHREKVNARIAREAEGDGATRNPTS